MYTMILVEDDYQIRNGLHHFFPWQQIGFQMLESFENGQQALDYLKTRPVDVVLTDIRMPVLDGLSLAEELARWPQGPCVVVMSAYRDFDYAHRALSLGIHHYMIKTARYDDLVDIFTRLKAELDGRVTPEAPADTARITQMDMSDGTVRRITEHILENLSTASLQTAAAHVSLSPVYVSQYFKEKTGVHFIDYLIHLKMRHAAFLLADPAVKLWEISETVGYSNEKNFSRAFKKHYGVSPNEYRKLV